MYPFTINRLLSWKTVLWEKKSYAIAYALIYIKNKTVCTCTISPYCGHLTHTHAHKYFVRLGLKTEGRQVIHVYIVYITFHLPVRHDLYPFNIISILILNIWKSSYLINILIQLTFCPSFLTVNIRCGPNFLIFGLWSPVC